MTEDLPAAPGRPLVFVLSTPDPKAVTDYYSSVLGWKLELAAAFPAAGTGGSDQRFLVREGPVGWLPFLPVADLASVRARSLAAGAQRFVHPLPGDDDSGRAAILIDPEGTRLGLFEGPRDAGGAGLSSEDGTVIWIEQKTRDGAASTNFLRTVFGFSLFGESGPGKVQLLRPADGPPYGGVMQFDDRWSVDHPSHWLIYARVSDLDDALARVTDHGGSVWFPPTPTPLGPISYVRDPAGNAVALVEVARSPDELTVSP